MLGGHTSMFFNPKSSGPPNRCFCSSVQILLLPALGQQLLAGVVAKHHMPLPNLEIFGYRKIKKSLFVLYRWILINMSQHETD